MHFLGQAAILSHGVSRRQFEEGTHLIRQTDLQVANSPPPFTFCGFPPKGDQNFNSSGLHLGSIFFNRLLISGATKVLLAPEKCLDFIVMGLQLGERLVNKEVGYL